MFTFIRVMMSMIGVGPIAAPRRQPVIAYFLLNVYRMTVRSCMPGRDTIESLAPRKRTSKYASSLSTSRSCLIAISAMRSSSSARALGGGRVVQVVEDEQARARRDAPLDGVDVQGVAVAVVHVPVGHGDPTDELDERGVDREAGVGIEDLVAHVHGGHQELADDGLAARLHRHVVGGVGDVPGGADVRRQSFAQRGDAGVGAVGGPAVADGPRHRRDDGLGGGDVQVAEVPARDLRAFVAYLKTLK